MTGIMGCYANAKCNVQKCKDAKMQKMNKQYSRCVVLNTIINNNTELKVLVQYKVPNTLGTYFGFLSSGMALA